MAQAPSRTEIIAKLGEMVRGIEFAMLATVGPDGAIYNRPMATPHNAFDGDFWFFTRAESGKVHDIEHNPHVNVSFTGPGQSFVSVSGIAKLVRDRARIEELWHPDYQAWIPEGLNDPHLALIQVTVESAECWESPSSPAVHIAGFIQR